MTCPITARLDLVLVLLLFQKTELRNLGLCHRDLSPENVGTNHSHYKTMRGLLEELAWSYTHPHGAPGFRSCFLCVVCWSWWWFLIIIRS